MENTFENAATGESNANNNNVEVSETTQMRFSEVRTAMQEGKSGFNWSLIDSHEIAVKIPEKRDLKLLLEQMSYWKLRPIQVL